MSALHVKMDMVLETELVLHVRIPVVWNAQPISASALPVKLVTE